MPASKASRIGEEYVPSSDLKELAFFLVTMLTGPLEYGSKELTIDGPSCDLMQPTELELIKSMLNL